MPDSFLLPDLIAHSATRSPDATALTYELYRGASLDEIQVKRTISRSAGNRNKVGELLALYLPGMVFDGG